MLHIIARIGIVILKMEGDGAKLRLHVFELRDRLRRRLLRRLTQERHAPECCAGQREG